MTLIGSFLKPITNRHHQDNHSLNPKKVAKLARLIDNHSDLEKITKKLEAKIPKISGSSKDTIYEKYANRLWIAGHKIKAIEICSQISLLSIQGDLLLSFLQKCAPDDEIVNMITEKMYGSVAYEKKCLVNVFQTIIKIKISTNDLESVLVLLYRMQPELKSQMLLFTLTEFNEHVDKETFVDQIVSDSRENCYCRILAYEYLLATIDSELHKEMHNRLKNKIFIEEKIIEAFFTSKSADPYEISLEILKSLKNTSDELAFVDRICSNSIASCEFKQKAYRSLLKCAVKQKNEELQKKLQSKFDLESNLLTILKREIT